VSGRVARTAGRVAAIVALGAATLAVTAAPASAHNASGPRPTNYLTTLSSISPRIPGVTVRVVELGNKIQLTNRTDADVIVLGYNSDPYLRVGPRGLYENLRSSSTYLNRTRTGTADVPAIATGTGASTPPRWHRISGSHTATWHDHRIHLMGSSPPAVVRDHPNAVHTIDPQWTVAFRYGAQTAVVHGTLVWIPGPSGWPWLALVVVLFALGILAARRRGVALIAALVVLVGVDMAHTISAEAARAGTQLAKTVQYFGDNFVSVIVWAAAGLTIWALVRRRAEAVYGVLLVGVMVALVSGVTDLSYLWKSQLPALGPHVVSRAAVAIALGLGLGLAAGALVVLRSATRVPRRAVRDPLWIERLVAGLDDDGVRAECARLDAAEVIPMALTDAAGRWAPIAGDLGSEAVVFVVLAQDEIGSHVWSVAAAGVGGQGLRVQRGRPAPARVELRITFPAFLCLLGGTLTVDRAVASGRLDITGDRTIVDALADGFGPRPVSTVGSDA
jgi:hypothetical protein